MAPTMKDLGIDRWSVADRMALAMEIWDSIATSTETLPITEEVKCLLDRRLAELDANPANVVTWEEIQARIRGKR